MYNKTNNVKRVFDFSFCSNHVYFFLDCQENHEIYEWLLSNMKHEWNYYRIDEGFSISPEWSNTFMSILNPIIIVCFNSDEDASLFKLTWM